MLPMSNSQEPNPFAPPTTDIEAGGAAAAVAAAASDLATRWQRLGGALIDALLYAAATAPAYLGVSWTAFVKASQTEKSPLLLYRMAGTWGIVAGALLLAISIVNWTLLARRGQTLGKIAAGTRVVMLDGSAAPFGKIVGLRTWVFHLPNYIPGLNRAAGVLSVVDALFVYRADRRCLHDQLAGTKVVRVARAA
jgi:uncharacterized RDD family membrane protein YckC